MAEAAGTYLGRDGAEFCLAGLPDSTLKATSAAGGCDFVSNTLQKLHRDDQPTPLKASVWEVLQTAIRMCTCLGMC